MAARTRRWCARNSSSASHTASRTRVSSAAEAVPGSCSVPTVTVKKGTKVTWRWAGKDMHNVAVTKGPVKFRSSFKTSGSFSKKLTRTGTYTLVCTIHQPDMKMKLRVTR